MHAGGDYEADSEWELIESQDDCGGENVVRAVRPATSKAFSETFLPA